MRHGPAGFIVLSVVAVCLMAVGCGASRGGVSGADLPPTHRQVAEAAIRRALEDAGIRADDRPVAYEALGNSDGVSIVDAVLPEVLTSRGFSMAAPSHRDAGIVAVTLDSLGVLIDKGNEGKVVKRTGTARVSVVHTLPDSSRRVYVGQGIYTDSYDRRLLGADKTEAYVIDRSSSRRFLSMFKPVVIGTVLTVFTWALYSYRG